MAMDEPTRAHTFNMRDFPQIIRDEDITYTIGPENLNTISDSYGLAWSNIGQTIGNNIAQRSGQINIAHIEAMLEMCPPIDEGKVTKESRRMGIIKLTEEALIEALGIVTGGVDITHIEFHRMDNTIDIVIKADKPRVEFGDGSIIDLPKRVEGSQIPYVTPQREQGEEE